MKHRNYGTKRDIEIEVDSVTVDLYDYLDDWDDEDFDAYFNHSGRTYTHQGLVEENYAGDPSINYDQLAWEICRGNVDKAKLLKAIEGIN